MEAEPFPVILQNGNFSSRLTGSSDGFQSFYGQLNNDRLRFSRQAKPV
jgi:hypothetical protein